MLKVMTIVGTRPELIKMSRVIPALDRHFQHVLVHTGQNFDYELNEVFFEEMELRKPDHFLGVGGVGAMQGIAQIIAKADDVMEVEQPGAVLIYGDTNSGLSVIAAKRRKIPVFHMEAGNRCFDQRVPEELNRKLIDHLADINLVLSEHARRHLIAEGLRHETIIKTGSHMREVLDHYLPRIRRSEVCARLGLAEGRYFLVSAHREENVDDADTLKNLVDALNGLSEAYGWPVIVSVHPRTRQRIEALGPILLRDNVIFCKPFGFFDYIKLQLHAYCVVSDSGTITEEAALLDLPAITIRAAHERPEGMDAGTLVMCGLRRDRVLEAVQTVIRLREGVKRPRRPIADYENGDVSGQVVMIVRSYVDYVNRTVWAR